MSKPEDVTDAALAEAKREGIRTAIRWLRELPRIEVVVDGERAAESLFRSSVNVAARRLEERLEASEEVTRPDLPLVPER